MKKLLCILLCFTLFAGCTAETSQDLDTFLLEKTLLAVQDIKQMVQSEGYASFWMNDIHISQALEDFNEATDTEPISAMIVSLKPNGIDAFLPNYMLSRDLGERPKVMLGEWLIPNLTQTLTGQYDNYAASAASMYVVNKSCMSHPELTENSTVILSYSGGYAVWVQFMPSEENTVRIIGSFLVIPEDKAYTLLDGTIFDLLEEDWPIDTLNIRTLRKTEIDAMITEQ